MAQGHPVSGPPLQGGPIPTAGGARPPDLIWPALYALATGTQYVPPQQPGAYEQPAAYNYIPWAGGGQDNALQVPYSMPPFAVERQPRDLRVAQPIGSMRVFNPGDGGPTDSRAGDGGEQPYTVHILYPGEGVLKIAKQVL